MKDSRLLIAAYVMVGILLLSAVGYVVYRAVSDDGDDTDDGGDWQIIDRDIKFPYDEGKHKEPYESWIVGLDLKDFEGARFSSYVRYAHEDRYDRRYATVSSLNDPDFSRLQKNSDGILTVTEGGLNLTYSDDDITDLFYSTGELTYYLEVNFGSGPDGPYYMRLNITDEKKYPVLPFEEGTLVDYTIGTSYEYFQSRLSVFGYYRFGDTSGFIEGSAILHHRWDFMSRYSEDIHWLQLEDGRDLWLYKMYSPEKTTYITNTIIIGEDGVADQDPMVNFATSVNKYSPVPGIYDVIAFGTSWTVQNTIDDIDLRIDGVAEDQFVGLTAWAGVVKFNGTLKGESVQGRGFALTSLSYYAMPYIEEMSAAWRQEIDPLPLENFTVRAKVYDAVPLDMVLLRYNASYREAPADPVYFEIEMYPGDDGYYYGHFPTPRINYVVSYKVVAVDILGVMKESPRETVVIEFDY